jgi:hypothetical protein
MRRPRRLRQFGPQEAQAVEIIYGTSEPIPLTELAESFGAIDRIYVQSGGEERLAVSELRSGSIIATLAPFYPLMNQVLPTIAAMTTLSDFTRKLKKAIDGFAEIDGSPPSPAADPVASEIAAVMRPLAGKKGAKFGLARVRYRSKSADREVEVVAEYNSEAIDRAVLNAERFNALAQTAPVPERPPQERNFVRGVAMAFQQANRGPAKAKGSTGDKGIIEAVSDKAVPVYFNEGISRLKDRMVRTNRNTPHYEADRLTISTLRSNGFPLLEADSRRDIWAAALSLGNHLEAHRQSRQGKALGADSRYDLVLHQNRRVYVEQPATALHARACRRASH